MANTDAPFGLKPKRHKNGAPYNGASRRYYRPSSDATNLFIGDAVVRTGSGDTDGIPGVIVATPGSGITGVIVGIENLTPDNLSRTYLPASTAGYLLVADDPDLMFEAQEDSVGAALAAADIGLNANVVFGTGNTVTGTSAVEIDSSTKATTATLDVRLDSIVQRADNAIGDNAKWLVWINNHTQRSTTGA